MSAGAAEKKIVLERLGYSCDGVTKKSGWSWDTSTARSDGNQPTESDAIDDVWRDAGERTQGAMDIPAATWERMSIKEQAELIQEGLPGP